MLLQRDRRRSVRQSPAPRPRIMAAAPLPRLSRRPGDAGRPSSGPSRSTMRPWAPRGRAQAIGTLARRVVASLDLRRAS